MQLHLKNVSVFACAIACFSVVVSAPTNLQAQETPQAQGTRTPLDEEGRVVVFQRDIAPIFAAKCLECHEGDKAKADFRINESDSVLGYVVAEDPAGSMLYADYITAADDDMMMPPPSHGGPLSPGEIALVKTWIEEGAAWPETAVVALKDSEPSEKVSVDETVAGQSALSRFWAFQGYFHPATVHFPIALLSIGGLFVVLGLKWPKIGTQVPLACLLIGSVSAVVATAMGWGFAPEEGYGGYKLGFEREIDAHRWSGTIVAAASVLLALVALLSINRESKALNFVWKSGLLVLALTVGLVGHQGGELTYGKTFYAKAFERLRGKTAEIVDETAELVEDVEETLTE